MPDKMKETELVVVDNCEKRLLSLFSIVFIEINQYSGMKLLKEEEMKEEKKRMKKIYGYKRLHFLFPGGVSLRYKFFERLSSSIFFGSL